MSDRLLDSFDKIRAKTDKEVLLALEKFPGPPVADLDSVQPVINKLMLATERFELSLFKSPNASAKWSIRIFPRIGSTVYDNCGQEFRQEVSVGVSQARVLANLCLLVLSND